MPVVCQISRVKCQSNCKRLLKVSLELSHHLLLNCISQLGYIHVALKMRQCVYDKIISNRFKRLPVNHVSEFSITLHRQAIYLLNKIRNL